MNYNIGNAIRMESRDEGTLRYGVEHGNVGLQRVRSAEALSGSRIYRMGSSEIFPDLPERENQTDIHDGYISRKRGDNVIPFTGKRGVMKVADDLLTYTVCFVSFAVLMLEVMKWLLYV